MDKSNKDYLGDAVYADIEYGDLVLTTEDGISVTNRIVLDHYTLGALLQYAQKRGLIEQPKST